MHRKRQEPQFVPERVPQAQGHDLANDLDALEGVLLSLPSERKVWLFELLTRQLMVETKRLLRPEGPDAEQGRRGPAAAQEPRESYLAGRGKLLSQEGSPTHVGGRPPGHSAEEWESFEQGRRYYREHFEELLAKYGGKYIAIVDDQVVDSDPSFHELATRVYAKYGYRDMFMPKVVRDRVVNIPTPRLRPLE